MKPSIVIVTAAFVTVLLGVVMAIIFGIPSPAVHDEFSYLLGADTLLQGRFANPVPVNSAAFETFHVLMSPTYASKYPPGQSIFLALGAWFGIPILGVWISSAIAVAACLWAIKPEFHGKELAIAAYVATVLIGLGYWNNSYWGGSVAAAGGALFYGALRRVFLEMNWQSGAMTGLGAGVLLLSRPFEGVVFCVVCLFCLIKACCSTPETTAFLSGKSGQVLKISFLFVMVLGPAVGVLLAHNQAVTGQMFTLPHIAYGRTYLTTPAFLFQDLRSTVRESFDLLAKFNLHEQEVFAFARSNFWAGFATRLKNSLIDFYFYPVFLWSLLFLPVQRDFWTGAWRFVTPLVFGISFVMMITTTSFPHYLAPFTVLIIAVIVMGMRNFVRMLPVASFKSWVTLCILIAAGVARAHGYLGECQKNRVSWQNYREEMKNMMQATGEQHLVFVAYDSNHSAHAEWVFNGSNIKDATVIWARSRSIEKDREVLMEISNKGTREIKTWKLDPDQKMGLKGYDL